LILLASVMLLAVGAGCRDLPPSDPLVLGPVQAWPDTALEFRVQALDPDGDQVEYWLEWGDGGTTGWTEPAMSATWQFAEHSFADTGRYAVRARARSRGLESAWSDTHAIVVGEFGPFVPFRPVKLGRDTVPLSDTVGWMTRAGHPLDKPVALQFDWGDTLAAWSEPFPAGDWVTLNHVYDRAGVYAARVRARDRREHVTDWSAPGTVWVVDSIDGSGRRTGP
jgi:hypothetical protein